jgi:hypothetical protein
MRRRFALGLLLIGAVVGLQGWQVDFQSEIATFESRLATYVEMHRRLEGPIPPLAVTSDMDEVRRLMEALRVRIRAERGNQGQGFLLTPAMVSVLRTRISSCLTIEQIEETMADVAEHTPPNMPQPRVNEPLPDDAPFVMVPPEALRTLPPLPPELRYVVLSGALIIWDHHADLIVDIAPGVFDAATYRSTAQPVRAR